MTEPTPADYHISIDGAEQGPGDEGAARALAAQHMAAGRHVVVWRPGWSSWVPASQVWRGPDPSTTARAPVVARPTTNAKLARTFAALMLGSVALVAVVVGITALLTPGPPDPEHRYVKHMCGSCGEDSRPCAAAMTIERDLPERCAKRMVACEVFFGDEFLETAGDLHVMANVYFGCTGELPPKDLYLRAQHLIDYYERGSYESFARLRDEER